MSGYCTKQAEKGILSERVGEAETLVLLAPFSSVKGWVKMNSLFSMLVEDKVAG